MKQKALMAHKIWDLAACLAQMDSILEEVPLDNLNKLTNYVQKFQHSKRNLIIAIKISQCLMMKIWWLGMKIWTKNRIWRQVDIKNIWNHRQPVLPEKRKRNKRRSKIYKVRLLVRNLLGAVVVKKLV